MELISIDWGLTLWSLTCGVIFTMVILFATRYFKKHR